MDWGLNFATAVMALVGGTVGLKLLSRSRQTRQLADFSVALGLFCYATMAQAGRFLTFVIDPQQSPMLEFSAASYRIVGFFLTGSARVTADMGRSKRKRRAGSGSSCWCSCGGSVRGRRFK